MTAEGIAVEEAKDTTQYLSFMLDDEVFALDISKVSARIH